MTLLEKQIHQAGGEIQVQGRTFSQSFLFSPSFAGFDGHFPNAPILPAMVQILMGCMSTSQALKIPLTLSQVRRAKFVRKILPEENIHLAGTFEDNEEGLLSAVTLTVQQETAATFRLHLQHTRQKP